MIWGDLPEELLDGLAVAEEPEEDPLDNASDDGIPPVSPTRSDASDVATP